MPNPQPNSPSLLPRQELGTTGLRVSSLGLGLVKIGRTEGLKYPNAFELPSDVLVYELLKEAHSLGINLLDTAPAYGTSEQRLGEALAQLPDLSASCIISTKVGESFENGKSSFDFSPDAIKRSVERSLRRLRRTKLDIVLLHSSGADEEVLADQQPLATLQQLQYEGVIGACGFSGKTLSGGRQALELGAEILMITVNETQRDELPLLKEARECGAGVLIKKPMGSGHGSTDGFVRLASEVSPAALIVGTANPQHLRENAQLLLDAEVSAGSGPAVD